MTEPFCSRCGATEPCGHPQTCIFRRFHDWLKHNDLPGLSPSELWARFRQAQQVRRMADDVSEYPWMGRKWGDK